MKYSLCGESPADHTVTGPQRGRGGEGQRELRLDMAREGTGPPRPGGKASWEGAEGSSSR